MKAIGGLLVIAVLALAIIAYQQWQNSNAVSARVQALEEKVATRKEGASLVLQAQCADHARKTFKEFGYKPSDMAGYESHYSVKYNKCFMITSNTKPTGKEVMTFMNLTDAIEGRDYGTYSWLSQPNKKYWEVKPFMCNVLMPTGERQSCESQDEFENLANTYMRD